MKTLSIKNPWAYLLAKGIKDVENRSRPTNYRGIVLLHASKQPDSRYREMSRLFTPAQWEALDMKEQQRAVVGIYDSSAIIGSAFLVDCVKNSSSIWAEPEQYHWIFDTPTLYAEPTKGISGKLGLWNYSHVELLRG